MSTAEGERGIMARLRGLARAPSAAAARAELARIAPTPAPAGEDKESSLCDAFLHRAASNGFSAERVASRSEAVKAAAAFLATRQNHRRFAAGHDPRLAAMPWRDAGLLPRFGAATEEDLIAMSYARGAIAETGSVVLWTDRANPALNSLLCDAQVIFVDAADVRQSLEDVWADWPLAAPATRPRGLMLVSGPSSTADIALKLVLGAHGPRAVHLVVLDSLRPAPTVDAA